jgi:DNA-binding transcriptional ArsR family regulator
MEATALDGILDEHRRGLNPRAVLAYLLIAQELEAGHAFPSVYFLARRLGVQVRMASRYLRELREAGVVERTSMHVNRLPLLDRLEVEQR